MLRTYQDLLAVGENEKGRMEFVRGAVFRTTLPAMTIKLPLLRKRTMQSTT